MNEYLLVLNDGRGNTSWRVIRSANYADALSIFLDDEDCEGFLIEKVYVRLDG